MEMIRYEAVPKDVKENLRYRVWLRTLCRKSPQIRRQVWKACAREPLFWINSFVYTYDPRARGGMTSRIPFVTYQYQDRDFRLLFESIGVRDLAFRKSRDMGASWECLTALYHGWLFRPGQSYLMVSRNADYVDKPGNPKSLFWKIDFITKGLPAWMVPRFSRTAMHLENLDNASVISGESTTGDVARGDRRSCIMLDEFAAFEFDDGYRALTATQYATNSRLFNSTPQGDTGAYADIVKGGNCLVVECHWSLHPEKSKGLYQFVNDKLKVIDKGYVFPADYRYVQDGKLRSPWYDEECRRMPVPQLVAQELDMDFGAAKAMFFDATTLRRYEAEICRDPLMSGELICDRDSLEFERFKVDPAGKIRLWLPLDGEGRWPDDRTYVVGVDVAFGTGASSSALVAYDAKTNEKCLEFRSSRHTPIQFAEMAVAICRWLKGKDGKGAYLIWEANGPGRNFGSHVREGLGYSNIWYKTDVTRIARKPTDIPGWYTTQESKMLLLGDYREALNTTRVVNRSLQAIGECREYMFLPNGSVAHEKAINSIDPSGARDNHGDLVIADALASFVLKERFNRPDEVQERVAPIGTLAWRQELAGAGVGNEGYW